MPIRQRLQKIVSASLPRCTLVSLTNRELLFLLFCCVSSFLIQLYFLYKASPPWNTFFEHGLMAIWLAGGKGFVIEESSFFSWAGPSAYRAPLYVAYLAFLMKYLGLSADHYLFAYYIHIVITSLFCFPVYRIAKHIFSPAVAAISVLVLITDYFVITQNFRLLPEVFLTGIMLVLLVNLYKIQVFQLRRYAAFSGFLFGVGALVKPVILTFLPVTLLWLCALRSISLRKRLSCIGLLCTLAIVTVLPWTIRNYVVFNKFIPVDTSFGVNFWQGNNEKATGSLAANDGDSTHWPTPAMEVEMRGMNEAERNEYLIGAGLTFIREHPFDFLVLRLKSLFYFWFTYNYWTHPHPAAFSFDFDLLYFEFSRYYLVLFNLLLIIGTYIAIRNRNEVFLIVGLALAFSALYSLTHAYSILRYCSPLHPALSVLVASALYEPYRRIVERRREPPINGMRQ
ncbi:MAG: hypothetical protein C4532_14025 [Candidatus Abyssobacteria bacterium SURF_17]|jgi:hypothetical protein|uniref:Glycosyltransferase RgtA/B/C/D-like domain-containing protein n=1 Tax=Candidatus Abyssobacteria bacterium SURF_17 TaxID=2093361 RepID=A0A419EUE5_9BACT|nr:MAG: hypothetical protein C4532_14025 [Candidatus Abyssubacteria bacterium SURF_17]